MPGYTHMRKAMPSSAEMWAGSFIESIEDDKAVLEWTHNLIDQSPLGTGAGFGVPIELDRNFTAKEMGFARVQKNPLYVQLSRGKFEGSILHALNFVMMDLNKMASDIILYSMTEFGFFELSPTICTGSSIMPQKTNPDPLELIRAQYHQTMALEFQVKSTIANLSSGYQRDMQLTKEATIKGFQITKQSLVVMAIVMTNMSVNKEHCAKAMTQELYATKKAYDLVGKGIPFREAYQKVAQEFLKKDHP